MTTFFAPHDFEMDLPHPDDKMEIGTSPYPHADDIDFDFDNDRQQSVDRSMVDDVDAAGIDADFMQADIENIYNDDDMLDDETMQPSYDEQNDLEDLNMEPYGGAGNQDEEILYDEEGASVDMVEQQDFTTTDDSMPTRENDEVQVELPNEAMTQKSIQDVDQTNNHVMPEIREENTKTFDDSKTDTEEYSVLDVRQEGTITTTDVVDFAAEVVTDLQQSSGHEQTKTVEEDDDTLRESKDFEPEQLPAEEQQTSTLSESQHPIDDAALASQNAESAESSEHENQSHESTEPLHPVSVVYLGQEMSLFPPMANDSSATFFVSDSALAFEPMEKLLASCREILGDSLEHDDELVLDIPALGLHICEDSKYASQITLSQVLEVYLTLSHNESIETVEPLNCTLSSRVCLASQYEYLASSAAEGKTYSEIAAEHVDSPDANSIDEEVGDQQLTQPAESANAEQVNSDQEKTQEESVDSLIDEFDSAEQVTLPAEDYAQSTETHEITADKERAVAESSTEVSLERTSPAGPQAENDILLEPPIDATGTSNDIEGIQADNEEANEEGNEVNDDEDSLSTSSHTIEGEPAEKLQGDAEISGDSTIPEGRHTSPPLGDDFDENEAPEDLFNDAEKYDFLDPEHESSVQPELVSEGAVTNGGLQKAASANPSEQAENDHFGLGDLAAVEEDTFGHNSTTDELDLLGVDEISSNVPHTPSKPNASKRKAFDEEEELDFLDISTPEPKRTRAS